MRYRTYRNFPRIAHCIDMLIGHTLNLLHL